MMRIAVIGLGYVGLPLSLQFACSGNSVIGIDIDTNKVETLMGGDTYIKHITADSIATAVKNKSFSASTDFSLVKEATAVIICVPTPLNTNREPDISCIIETGRKLALHIQKGTLVVLESTSYPGTTEEELRKTMEITSGFKAGIDFHLAFSPEREDPGNHNSRLEIIPKIVGGYTPACLRKAKDVYSTAIKTLIPVSSCRAAEATKLLENTFRSVNIALVNELKMIYSTMGIDIWEVIEAAKTKPFGFMPFYPGPGTGGHCIPIDPLYLMWQAKQYGQQANCIELADKINTTMPQYILERLTEALKWKNKTIKGSRILILGLAYKPNVDDDRNSPSYALMETLVHCGAAVSYYDPYIPVVNTREEYNQWAGTKSITWDQSTIEEYDAVVLATNHTLVNYEKLARWADCIIDTRNAMNGIDTKLHQVWKA